MNDVATPTNLSAHGMQAAQPPATYDKDRAISLARNVLSDTSMMLTADEAKLLARNYLRELGLR